VKAKTGRQVQGCKNIEKEITQEDENTQNHGVCTFGDLERGILTYTLELSEASKSNLNNPEYGGE
jgi:hypothetical protein